MIDNKLALVTIISMISVGLFTLTMGTYVDDNNVFAKKLKTRIGEQVNDCGNNVLTTNVTCSNSGSNSEGHENINNMTIVHYSFLPFP